MREIRVLINASCNPTNISNGFVDMGVIYSLKSAFGTRGPLEYFSRRGAKTIIAGGDDLLRRRFANGLQRILLIQSLGRK